MLFFPRRPCAHPMVGLNSEPKQTPTTEPTLSPNPRPSPLTPVPQPAGVLLVVIAQLFSTPNCWQNIYSHVSPTKTIA